MRRISALVVGVAAGVLAAAAAARRRRSGAAGGTATADPRAEELRRKLAEARESAAVEDDFDVQETEPLAEERTTRADTPVVSGDDVEEARRRIHDEGRAAAEEMRADPDA